MNQKIILLKNAITVLTLSSDKQLEYLQKLGLPSGIDELVLEFDDAIAIVEEMLCCGEINQSQYDMLKRLDSSLSRMSGQTNSSLWTADALSSAPEWNEVRKLATECLKLWQPMA